MSTMSAKEALEFAEVAKECVLRLEAIPKPVIDALKGLALGGGCELALACHFRIASTTAKFGLPEINLGIIPGNGGTHRLTRMVGVNKAKEMIMLGEIITAEEALRIGLVNQVVDAGELMKFALDLGNKLAQKAPVALAMAKRAINRALGSDVVNGLDFEANCFAHCFSTEDQHEGMKAFLEKRLPRFRGC